MLSLRSVGKKTNTVLMLLNSERHGLHLTLGLGVVGEFEKRPPGTAADALLMYKIR